MLTKYVGKLSKVHIPIYIQGSLITEIGESAFAHCQGIDYVECSLTIKEIKEYAFANSSIKVIKLHNGMKRIGKNAFASCERLRNILLPAQMEVIQEGAFQNCSQLPSIKLPKTVKTIEDNCFSGCVNLKTVEFSYPSSCKVIGWSSFSGCQSLTHLFLPQGLEEIGEKAFAHSGLSGHLQLPSSLSVMKTQAFFHCKDLESINFPNSLTEVDHSVFQGCEKLIARYLPESQSFTKEDLIQIFQHTAMKKKDIEAVLAGSKFCESIENKGEEGSFLLSKGEISGYTGDFSKVILPSMIQDKEVHSLKKGLFSQNTELVSLVLPPTLGHLSPLDFFACRYLKDITLPYFLKQIPTMCFSECFSLESIQLPPYIFNIGFSAFRHCRALKKIALPESMYYMEEQAFGSCKNLEAIYLPPSLQYLEKDVFFDCGTEKPLKIYGKVGTKAEQYAKDLGFPFCAVLGDVPEFFFS